MIRVKICGITNLADALAAVKYGADALGFIFYKKSPRYINPQAACEIISKLPPFITTVGIFVNETSEIIMDIREKCSLNLLQLHGEEPPEFLKMLKGGVIKALRVKDNTSPEIIKRFPAANGFLLDSYTKDDYGGSGTTFNWKIAKEAVELSEQPIILAGGLTPDNVSEAVRTVRPYGVDTSSGVEKAKGIKDHKLIKNFIIKAKEAGNR